MIKATVRYSSEHYIALNKVFGLSPAKRFRTIAVMTIVDVLYAAYIVKSALNYGISLSSPLGFVNFFGVIIASVLTAVVVKTIIKLVSSWNELKNMEPVKEIRHFVFDDEKFCMLCERQGYYIDQRIHYSELRKACEWENFFFIGVDEARYCIIAKNEITEGTPEELRALLVEKLLDRFEAR